MFSLKVEPGRLIVADRYGFRAIAKEVEDQPLEAVKFMEEDEQHAKLAVGPRSQYRTSDEFLDAIDEASRQYRQGARDYFKRSTTDE